MFGNHLVDISKMSETPLIIDAGACVGNFIDDIFKWTEDPMFIAIEPCKSNVEILRAKYRKDNVITIEAALVGGAEPSILEFDEFEGLPEWGNVTGLYKTRPHKTYKVETLNLKELLDFIPHDIIDLLKMDIEGCEHQVIQDMTMNQAKRISQITMEVHNGLGGMLSKLEWLGYNTRFENGELYGIRKELG